MLILIVMALLAHRNRGLEQTTVYLIEGFQFGFKVFGPVIPIAAFFYLGDAAFTELFGNRLPQGSYGIVNDLGVALAHNVPLNDAVGALTLAVTGAITGLHGSGFSGISLVGSVCRRKRRSCGHLDRARASGGRLGGRRNPYSVGAHSGGGDLRREPLRAGAAQSEAGADRLGGHDDRGDVSDVSRETAFRQRIDEGIYLGMRL